MPETVRDIWVYLSATPLLHLWLTVTAFQVASWIAKKAGGSPLLNPVMLSVAAIVGVLLFTGTSYATYFEGAQFVHFLLGPATVALAIPLYRQIARVKAQAGALAASLLLGGATAAASAVAIGWAFGGARDTLVALAPKSVTAPVAMGIVDGLGGLPSLAAVLVILTGVLGAMLGPLLLALLKVRDPAARGTALGVASHGIGTARALQMGEVEGAFSGLAMGLNALATASLLPLAWALLG